MVSQVIKRNFHILAALATLSGTSGLAASDVKAQTGLQAPQPTTSYKIGNASITRDIITAKEAFGLICGFRFENGRPIRAPDFDDSIQIIGPDRSISVASFDKHSLVMLRPNTPMLGPWEVTTYLYDYSSSNLSAYQCTTSIIPLRTNKDCRPLPEPPRATSIQIKQMIEGTRKACDEVFGEKSSAIPITAAAIANNRTALERLKRDRAEIYPELIK